MKARIPKEFIEELEEMFPERCARPGQSMEDVWYDAGFYSCIRRLRFMYEEQQAERPLMS